MSIEWVAYRRRLNQFGDDRRSRALNRTNLKILRDARSHPGCEEVLVNDVPQRIFTKRTDDPITVAFNTLPNEVLNLGDVVYWENRHWLVTESMKYDRMTYYGSFELCNRQLVWQNPKTREIIKRWCTVKKPYYSNLDVSPMAAVSTREFKVQLPSDFESNKINVDARFMLEIIDGNPKVYKCTSVDVSSKRYDVDGESEGFLILNLEQDQYDPNKDSAEYGVCNFLEPFRFSEGTEFGWCVIEASTQGLVPGGLPISLTARFFDKKGAPLDEKPVWDVQASDEVMAALNQQDHDNGVLRLLLSEDVLLIGQTIDIKASNSDGTIYETTTIPVVGAI